MRTLAFLGAWLMVLSGCGKSTGVDAKVGGLYSVKDDAGFKIVKVLAADDGIVHIRLYANKFPTRPETVDPSKLSMGNAKDKDGFGMGHLPLGEEMFASMQPKFIMQTTVLESELEGYRIWKESGGGAFK